MSLDDRTSVIDPYTDADLIEALENGQHRRQVNWTGEFGIMYLAAQRLKELLADTAPVDCGAVEVTLTRLD
jgi:hypothetical protein